MKIKGLKKAIGEYQRFNEGGPFSPEYGVLMFDLEDGEMWCDYFYNLGHNEWKEYHSKTIINLGRLLNQYDIETKMKPVKEFIIKYFEDYNFE